MCHIMTAVGLLALAGTQASASIVGPLSSKVDSEYASRAYDNQTIRTGIYLANRPLSTGLINPATLVGTHGNVLADTVPDDSRTSAMPGLLGAFTPDVEVTITVSEPIPGARRQIDIVWQTVNGAPFVSESTSFAGTNLDGLTPTDIIFTFGMVPQGMFPGGTEDDAFDDPDFISIHSSTGTLFNDTGNALGSMTTGLRVEGFPGLGLSGRLLYRLIDPVTELPTLENILPERAARYQATIVYNIPAPGAMGLLGLSGLAAARRRRR